MEANILKIERNVTGHGFGKRTVIYFKGCTLHCPSCYSPEAAEEPTNLHWDEKSCIFCGICMAYCPNRSISFENHRLTLDTYYCTFCGLCVKNCPSHTLHFVRKVMDIEEIMKIIIEDDEARQHSGGVTLSGGEPLYQGKIATEILKRCKELGISTAVETCCYGKELCFAKMLRYTDKLVVSIKHYDDRKHVQMTGVSNVAIIENIKYAAQIIPDIKAFIMINKGKNDSLCDARGYADLLKECGIKKLILKTYDCKSLTYYAEVFAMKGIEVEVVSVT